MNSPTQNHLSKLLLILLLCGFSAYSQKFDLTEKIPVDPNVKIGTLENGLTYYIRKNTKPENRAELRLFVNIGAVNEDDDQLGLAHFVEHMCFNGTKHFEENELIHYLQSIGMKMGPDINGFTSFDETVYMITVPTDDMEVFDKGLLIMEDWAHNVSFDHDEIDKERGIVIEEWRLGRGAGQRMSDQYLPVLFKDSHYAKRLPIGKKEIIESASYETVKRFYNDWYRPELMAFAVVGDVDLAETEKKIKEHFGRIEKKDKPREKKIYDIPDHKESLVSVVSDKENPYTQVAMVYKHNLEKQKNLGDLRKQLLVEMFTGMLNQRLNELREKADPPFIQGGTYYGQLWARNKSAYQSYVLVKEDGIEKGLQTLIEENERVKRFGFAESELVRYKKMMLKNYQSRYNERDKTESANYTWEYMDHFLKDKPIPGIEFLYEFAQETLPGIRVEEVNELAGKLVRDDNNVILVMGVEKEGVVLPKQEDLLVSVSNIDLSKLQAYEDKATSDKLMTELPKVGKVVNEKDIEAIEVKQFTLSNGAKVIIKPTDFKNDEVLFEATSEGGQSLYSERDMFSASFAANVVNESGTGPFKKTELSKFLAGKRVWVNPYIRDYYEGMNGGCSPEDLETMFQIIHLQFTQPKLDAEAAQSFISRGKETAKNMLSAPTSDFFIRYHWQMQTTIHGPTECRWLKIMIK